ncbi:hypothetical protein HX021_19405 [Sphingobacterium sp. N143]|uniref:hypothetical protein n=1 Tax=Sphingobacterium sp. N143 TaxID=2746727 RepID=UPI002578891F|nr:hypothetical protein [Sphingobacterium sp. N143]MDM1296457.1 hypothetical protein [Sphingobacterium sp. N143]
MKQNVGKYVIIDYHLDYKNCKGGRFVMESETDIELIKVSESVVCLQFKWSRRILRTDNHNIVTSLESLSHIEFGLTINELLISDIYSVLKNHEERNLTFIKSNSFDIFDNFQHVYYSSFLDENSIPIEERKQDMATWLETKIQELDLNN